MEENETLVDCFLRHVAKGIFYVYAWALIIGIGGCVVVGLARFIVRITGM